MENETRTAYEVLGVDPAASEEAIRLAYRWSVVSSHRDGVFAIADRLREIRAAYRTLRDPEARHAYDVARRQSYVDTPPRLTDNDQRTIAEGNVRVRMHQELRVIASRRGEEARLENAGTVRRLGHEYEERKRLAARQKAQRALARRVLQGALLAMTLATLAAMARHWPARAEAGSLPLASGGP
jgi:curved DNA-binding protein CbpA